MSKENEENREKMYALQESENLYKTEITTDEAIHGAPLSNQLKFAKKNMTLDNPPIVSKKAKIMAKLSVWYLDTFGIFSG